MSVLSLFFIILYISPEMNSRHKIERPKRFIKIYRLMHLNLKECRYLGLRIKIRSSFLICYLSKSLSSDKHQSLRCTAFSRYKPFTSSTKDNRFLIYKAIVYYPHSPSFFISFCISLHTFAFTA